MSEPIIKRDWLRIFSPCILTSILLVVVILSSLAKYETSGGWSMIGVIVFLPSLIILLVIDALVKVLSKNDTLFLWVVECGIIVLMILIFLKWIK